MHILIICHVYPPEHAPAGVMISELAEDLKKNNHNVTILTGWPNHPEGVLYAGWKMRWRSVEEESKGFRLVRCRHSIRPRNSLLWRLWYYFTFAISTLISGLSSGNYDVVICLSTPIFGSWAAWILSRIKRAHFIYDIFDIHPESAANVGLIKRGIFYRCFRMADTILCRYSDIIVTLSEGMRSEILTRGIIPNKVEVIPFWIDGKKIRPGAHRNEWSRALGITHDILVVLYAGTIGYISGAEILIETAKMLSDRKDILFLCIGSGPVKNILTEISIRLNLQNIRFMPFQPAQVLNQVQSTADICLVTLLPGASKTSMPSKVLGYLAAGRPIVASVDLDSDTANIIRNANCGRITKTQDPYALARAIEELADQTEVRTQLGRNGRTYFERYFSREYCINKYEKLLASFSMKNIESKNIK